MAYEEPRMIDSRRFGRYEKYHRQPLWTHINGLNPDGNWYITTNMRVIMQGHYATDKEAWEHGYDKNWLKDVYDFWCEPTEFHDKRRTFTMWMSRGCTDDNRTHITMSSICESTRFCNYSKDKFDNELTFIKPYWIPEEAFQAWENLYNEQTDYFFPSSKSELTKEEKIKRHYEFEFLCSMLYEEREYMKNSRYDLQPQQLKRLFPLGAKAELRLCGFDDAWQNFFWRRCDNHADPECAIVANKIKSMY
jgi:thymidylate synthase (FAD)